MNYIVLFLISYVQARKFCEQTKLPLEVGEWRPDLKHMDSATVENKPVSMSEGQIYVYENYFPGYIIKYIHVDNVAIRSCGASASIRNGGIGTSTVLIVLHADSNQEIRSVVDVWGVKDIAFARKEKRKLGEKAKSVKSLYLFDNLRTVNHNQGY